jgi:hypothetical protein
MLWFGLVSPALISPDPSDCLLGLSGFNGIPDTELPKNEKPAQHQVRDQALDCAICELETQILVFLAKIQVTELEIGRTGEADRYTRREHQSRLI